MRWRAVRYMVLLVCLLAAERLHAQEDSLFLHARTAAYAGNYNEAAAIMEKLLQADSGQTEYRIFLARVYSWKNEYRKADDLLRKLTDTSPPDKEALELHEQVMFLDSAYERQILLDDKGISWFPDQADRYRVRKAITLDRLGRNEEALQQLDSVSAADYKKEVDYLRYVILNKRKNSVSAGYLLTTFSPEGWAPWSFFHVGYERRLTRWTIAARLNYGRLYGNQALQAETDAYMRLRPKSYLYLNAGGSDRNAVFPLLRLGAEYYADPWKFLSTSIGGRYLHFSEDEVVLLTGHVGWNHGNHTVSYRPFVLLKETVPVSHVVAWRVNRLSKESYFQLEAQYGTVPYYFYTQNEFVRTSAFRAGVSGKFRIDRHFFVQPVLMYEYEEYLPGSFRNRFNTQLILTRRF